MTQQCMTFEWVADSMVFVTGSMARVRDRQHVFVTGSMVQVFVTGSMACVGDSAAGPTVAALVGCPRIACFFCFVFFGGGWSASGEFQPESTAEGLASTPVACDCACGQVRGGARGAGGEMRHRRIVAPTSLQRQEGSSSRMHCASSLARALGLARWTVAVRHAEAQQGHGAAADMRRLLS